MSVSGFRLREFEPGYWASTDIRPKVPPLWREWLGKVQTEAIEHSSLVLFCKMASESPAVLDGEDELRKREFGGPTSVCY